MSGMGSSLQLANQTVVAAFRSALIHQGIIALLIFFLLAMLWVSVREWLPAARHRPGAESAVLAAEPAGRRLIRVGFGVLWVVDGVLQMQSAMPLGLPSNVTEPAAAGAPGWVRHLVELRRPGMVVPPGRRGRRGRLDPDRHRHLAAHRRPRPMVPARRPGQCGLGPGGLDLR